jgi:hypothetical protein
MDIPFRWWDSDGTVRLKMAGNEDPPYLGCSEVAHGFPFCEAVVDFPARGYASAFGWVALVSGNHGRDFELDLRPQFHQGYPFGYFGDRPIFFDGPHTDEPNWDFLAHTFLCSLGGELLEFRKEARAILGFSWGFSKRDQRIEWFGPEPLSAEDWNRHLDYLRRRHGRWWWPRRWRWSFKPGFSQHPLEP